MMYRWRERLQRFLMGRYGTDHLYYGLLAVYFALLVANAFARNWILSVLGWAVFLYTFFRVFSRNRAARMREDRWFMGWWQPTWHALRTFWKGLTDRSAVWKRCPHCGATLRLPRKTGKHTVRCPKCGERFQMRVWIGPKKRK